jgi:hypothetical protein
VFGLLALGFFGPDSRTPGRLFAAAYVLFVAYVFAQALSGQPFLAFGGPHGG